MIRARYPSADRIPPVRGPGPDRPHGAVRGAGADAEFDLPVFAKRTEPVRDLRGLRLTPDAGLADAPQLDLLHVPGGFGQEALMEDEEVLGWVRRQAAGARCVSPCAPAPSLRRRRAAQGPPGDDALGRLSPPALLRRDPRQSTSGRGREDDIRRRRHLRHRRGAAGSAELRGDEAAQAIQLYMQYAPEPPFGCGTPETAPPAILGPRAAPSRQSRSSGG